MTLTFELDPDNIKVTNKPACQTIRSFLIKRSCPYTETDMQKHAHPGMTFYLDQ